MAGLQNAPVTKLLLGSIVVNTAIASVLDVRHLFSIDMTQPIWSVQHCWRLGVWQLLYQSVGETIFGAVALYKLADTERIMGSGKFASFVLIALSTTSILIPTIVSLVLRPLSSRFTIVASGLTPTIFALLFQYHALIPGLSVLGTKHLTATTNVQNTHIDAEKNEWSGLITNKFWMYAIAAQLATCRFPVSVVGAMTGWAVGALYHGRILPQNWRLPSFLTPFIDVRPVGTYVRERPSVPEIRTRQHNNRQSAEQASVAAPSETEIEALVSMMGVSREVAISTITASGGSVEAAVDALLAR